LVIKLINKCEMIVRKGGASIGADEIVRMGKEIGKKTFTNINEIFTLKTNTLL
jgi:molybdopterin biosynthesis enzyme